MTGEPAGHLEVVRTARRAAAAGLVVGSAGNISLRQGDHVLVTASGATFEAITADQVVTVDLDGAVVAGDVEPTSELELHLLLHRDAGGDGSGSRPRAVVHTHAPASTAVGLVLDELPVVHYQQLLLGGTVRVAPYATFGSGELARSVHAAIRDRQAALMANHGSVAVGRDLGSALDSALFLEWLCRLYLDASRLGTPRTLSEEQQVAVVEAAVARRYGQVNPLTPPEE